MVKAGAAALLLIAAAGCADANHDYSGSIVLDVDDTALGPEIAAVVRAAPAEWEDRTGLDLFAPMASLEQRHVTITALADPCTDDDHAPILGDTAVRYEADDPDSMRGTVRLCVSQLFRAGPRRTLAVVLHELGHTLRLAHSLDDHNVMHPGSPVDWTISDAQIDQILDTSHPF